MNLLQKMNAAEYKKLLDFKAIYPILGEDLIKALSEKIAPIQQRATITKQPTTRNAQHATSNQQPAIVTGKQIGRAHV